MSLVGVAMDLLLACLLVAALMYGVRLERKLKGLRDSQAGFAEAVLALDAAAKRAESGIETLKQASEQAHDELHDRILKARELKQELDKLIARAGRAVEAAPARASEPRPEARLPDPRPEARRVEAARPMPQPASISALARPGAARNLDEDLFETGSSSGPRR